MCMTMSSDSLCVLRCSSAVLRCLLVLVNWAAVYSCLHCQTPEILWCYKLDTVIGLLIAHTDIADSNHILSIGLISWHIWCIPIT